MSAAAQTKIFGIRVGMDPKVLVGALIVVAGFLFWFNTKSDDQSHVSSAPAAVSIPQSGPASVGAPAVAGRTPTQRRRGTVRDDRETLRLRTVDAVRGDVDPVLRLDLLARLQNLQSPAVTRNLFETGPATAATPQGAANLPVRQIPVTMPKAPTVNPGYPIPSQLSVNIPLKYYGFAKPVDSGQPNRGMFLDGDDILVAAEGQLLKQQYLVVQVTPTTAKLEDTRMKMGQTLNVIPEAVSQ